MPLFPDDGLFPGDDLFPDGGGEAGEGVAIGLSGSVAQASGALFITTPVRLGLGSVAAASGGLAIRTPKRLGDLITVAQASGILVVQALYFRVHPRLLVYIAETNLALQTIIKESQVNLLMTVVEPLPLNVEIDEIIYPVEIDERMTLVVVENPPNMTVEVDE